MSVYSVTGQTAALLQYHDVYVYIQTIC